MAVQFIRCVTVWAAAVLLVESAMQYLLGPVERRPSMGRVSCHSQAGLRSAVKLDVLDVEGQDNPLRVGQALGKSRTVATTTTCARLQSSICNMLQNHHITIGYPKQLLKQSLFCTQQQCFCSAVTCGHLLQQSDVAPFTRQWQCCCSLFAIPVQACVAPLWRNWSSNWSKNHSPSCGPSSTSPALAANCARQASHETHLRSMVAWPSSEIVPRKITKSAKTDHEHLTLTARMSPMQMFRL